MEKTRQSTAQGEENMPAAVAVLVIPVGLRHHKQESRTPMVTEERQDRGVSTAGMPPLMSRRARRSEVRVAIMVEPVAVDNGSPVGKEPTEPFV